MIMNYSTLSPGSHTLQLRIHNLNNETLELSTPVFVEKFHGDSVNHITPHSGWLSDMAVTSDGVTRMYDVNLQWSNESQGFEIVEIVPKSNCISLLCKRCLRFAFVLNQVYALSHS